MTSSADALVVGGDIHFRLSVRANLLREGYRVTLESSSRRGLALLRRHSFALCTLDITGEKRPREVQRNYQRLTEVAGTQLHLVTTRSDPQPP